MHTALAEAHTCVLGQYWLAGNEARASRVRVRTLSELVLPMKCYTCTDCSWPPQFTQLPPSHPASCSGLECSQIVSGNMTALHLCCCDSCVCCCEISLHQKKHTPPLAECIGLQPCCILGFLCAHCLGRGLHMCSVYLDEQGTKLDLAERGYVL